MGDAVLQEEQVKFIIEISSLLLFAANIASNILWEFRAIHAVPLFTTVYALSLHCA